VEAPRPLVADTGGAPVSALAQAMPPAARPMPRADSSAHCKDVALQRASDGALMGYDDDLQKTVYDGTYAGCMAWDAGHPAQ
jgi:hypothetical protein